MKNKITAILLSVACVCVSILPSALLNFNHVETEEVILEETNETPTWDVLYKGNSDAMKAYQETYDRVYKETYENLTKTQEQVQANIQATNEVTQQNIQSFVQDMVNSDWYKLIQANNEKVVKDIDTDKNNNLIVKYSNGTSKTIAIASAPTVVPTSTVNDYEQIGYKLNSGHVIGHRSRSGGECDYDVFATITLVKINNDITRKYEYEITFNYDINNIVWNGSSEFAAHVEFYINSYDTDNQTKTNYFTYHIDPLESNLNSPSPHLETFTTSCPLVSIHSITVH